MLWAAAVTALVLTSCSAPGTPAGAPATAPAGETAHATGSGGPAAPPGASPSLSASWGPTLDCGRIAPDVCERAVAIARAAHEADVRDATTIVVDDDCASLPKGCEDRQPFDAIVAFIAGNDTTGWYAYEVTGPDASTPTTAGAINLGVPDTIVQRLATPEPPVPIDQGVFLGYANVVDGFPIGDRFCNPKEEEPIVGGCGKLVATALAELGRTVPAHAPVVGVELYREDWRRADGNAFGFLEIRSSGMSGIAVVRLEDGRVDAFRVSCSGLGLPYCEASDVPRPPDGAVLPDE